MCFSIEGAAVTMLASKSLVVFKNNDETLFGLVFVTPCTWIHNIQNSVQYNGQKPKRTV